MGCFYIFTFKIQLIHPLLAGGCRGESMLNIGYWKDA